ncbi:MAG: hypothetical protein EKK61_02960 [Rickettsiales bacterium]|nr:MAG: hypothetical protein EKK61_02960 [Rickettsiales bacterium]
MIKKNRSKIQWINTLIILGCFLFIIFTTNNIFAEAHEISEVYIESTGNNKYEAKIKAHEQGMLRSLFLLANKLELPTTEIKKIPYADLKEVFKIKKIENELSTIERYRANVTYAYDKAKLFKLLLKYGGADLEYKFNEFIILPVFKQQNILNIWESDKRWNDLWSEARDILNDHKIVYPKKNLFYAEKINEKNLFNLEHEDFINIFNNILFKNVMIITAEFFTNRANSQSIMQVKKYIFNLNQSQAQIITEEFEVNTWADIAHNVNRVIDQVISEYGELKKYNELTDIINEGDIIYKAQAVKKPIIMNFDVFNPSELELIKLKLKKIKQIDEFNIEHDYSTRYKVIIHTNVDEYELAECLYLNGLSYRIHGNLYNLIDIQKGG